MMREGEATIRNATQAEARQEQEQVQDDMESDEEENQ